MTAEEERVSQAELSLEPLRSSQLYEQIAGRLTAKIRSGRLAPGDRLPSERELAKALGVSRPSVREAVAFLQNQRVIETRPGSGSFVAVRAPELVREHAADVPDVSPVALLDARALLEPAAAAHAATVGGTSGRAEELLDRMDELAEGDPGDPTQRREWSEGDRELHRLFAAMGTNSILEQMAAHVHRLMGQPLWLRFRDEAASTARRLRIYGAEHRLIYDSIDNGRVEQARLHAGEHVKRARRDMTLE
jgi:GntR family transcriptional repressor for pyruvate dehydrogenase complex